MSEAKELSVTGPTASQVEKQLREVLRGYKKEAYLAAPKDRWLSMSKNGHLVTVQWAGDHFVIHQNRNPRLVYDGRDLGEAMTALAAEV